MFLCLIIYGLKLAIFLIDNQLNFFKFLFRECSPFCLTFTFLNLFFLCLLLFFLLVLASLHILNLKCYIRLYNLRIAQYPNNFLVHLDQPIHITYIHLEKPNNRLRELLYLINAIPFNLLVRIQKEWIIAFSKAHILPQIRLNNSFIFIIDLIKKASISNINTITINTPFHQWLFHGHDGLTNQQI